MIKFKNVTKRYANNIAVDNVSFNIKEGEFFVLIGPSGCGKTKTLKMINQLVIIQFTKCVGILDMYYNKLHYFLI